MKRRTNWIIAALSLSTVLSALPAAAAEKTAVLRVSNVSCELCGPIVKRALSRVPGVTQVEVAERETTAIAKVVYDDAVTTVASLVAATINVGFPSTIVD